MSTGGGRPGPMWGGADGASAERTRLAWRRTMLAATAVALLTVRAATRNRFTVGGGLVIAAALIGWLGLLWLSQRRIAAMAHHEPAGIGRTLPATALMVLGLSVLGLLALLTGG
jgi:hypothetical protein